MISYWMDWLALLARWLHVITGIAWIGASFYFVWLDNHLRRPSQDEQRRGVHGALWSVHGGGFYHNRKYLLGPKDAPLSEDLHWFKWEAYWTWISGMLLLAIVYWYGASAYLVDARVARLSVPAAIGVSAGAIAGGWLVYHLLCKSLRQDWLLGIAVALFFVAADWALFQLLSARAAFLHVGAMLGTCMVANVFFVIIPGQRKIVEAIRAGQTPDPQPGIDAKRRSVHNTYFTLPVLLIMISNHYPMTYSHELGWLVLVALSLAGILIRQFFLVHHRGRLNGWLPAAALGLLLLTGVALMPQIGAPVTESAQVTMDEVQSILERRCNSCHSAHPSSELFRSAPAGAMFDTAEQISAMAEAIYRRTVVTRDMPLANSSQMTDAERARIATWFAQSTKRSYQ